MNKTGFGFKNINRQIYNNIRTHIMYVCRYILAYNNKHIIGIYIRQKK